MKQNKLNSHPLPDYTRGEEIMNMVTHIVGGAIGITALVLCIIKATLNEDIFGVIGSIIFGVSMILLYAVSSVYHGLLPCTGKRVMQIIDHCTIYFLIAGTYTPIALAAIRPVYPVIGWGVFIFVWLLTAIAATLTAIDMHKYEKFSMICYIGMGWCIVPFVCQVIEVLTFPGFLLILAGGLAYTLGAVLFRIGVKKRWFHSVFHIFVDIGSLLHFLGILLYGL